jgi:hypothetical protein
MKGQEPGLESVLPADRRVLAEAADEPVHQGRGFPSGRGDGGSDRTETAGIATGLGAGGTTDRGATNAVQSDRGNAPGSGRAEAAGV